MSIEVYKRAWGAKVSGSHKLMLLALAEHANGDGVCWPGYPKLADMIGTTQRQAMRVIDKLEQDGLIRKWENRGRGHSNLYFIKVGLPEQEAVEIERYIEQLIHEKGDTGVRFYDRKSQQNVTSRAVKRDTDVTRTKEEPTTKDSTDKSVDDDSTSHSQKDTLFPKTEYELELFKQINIERQAKGYSDALKFPSLACKQKFDQAAETLNGETKAMITKARENVGIGIKEIVNYVAGCAKRAGKTNQNRPAKGQGQSGRRTSVPGGQDSQADRSGGNAAGVREAFANVRRERRERAKQGL